MTYNFMLHCSDFYSPYAGITLTSIFENNKHMEHIRVFLFSDNISKSNRNKMDELFEQYNRELVIIDPTPIDEYLEKVKIPRFYNSYATYYKLFISRMIPEDVDKLLCLDSDLVIAGDLSDFFNVDLDGFLLGCAPDMAYSAHHLKRSWLYNCGVVMFNLTEWNKNACEKIIINQLKKNSVFPFVEQDIINYLFYDKIKSIDSKFNFSAVTLKFGIPVIKKIFRQTNKNKLFIWTEEFKENVEKSILDLRIIHCFDVFGCRPWHSNFVYCEEIKWDYYMSKSPWKDYQKPKKKLSLGGKCGLFFYRYMTASIFIFCFRAYMTFLTKRMIKASNFEL